MQRLCVRLATSFNPALVSVFAWFIIAEAALGGISNGGFESGGTGWMQINTPPGPGFGGTTITFPTSGTAAEGSEYAHLDSLAISATTTTQNYRQGNCTIKQTFSANAGDWVSFDYRDQLILSDTFGTPVDDAALIVTCGTNQLEDDVLFRYRIMGQSLGNGWYSYSLPPFPSAGTYTFTAEAFSGVQLEPGDFGTGRTESAEAIADIDAVALNSVPEPSTFALLGAAAVGGLACAWRTRASQIAAILRSRLRFR